MLLSAEEIARILRVGNDPLVITPAPNPDELRNSGAGAVDLRLGTWFMTPRHPRIGVLEVAEGRVSFGVEDEIMRRHYVAFGERFILHPRAFVLAATLEWLRLPRSLAGYIMGRSSWGRRGLIIATASGVHPGFTGCLTLELTNVGEVPIDIRPGMAICQLFLHETKGSTVADGSGFVGARRPALGRIELDRIARALRKPGAT
ncbi:MAG: dCTP deaminase [Deltaproteobacteria bacterium]|nr:dCTP deaminase [Deltaproteobacteria bacterium]MBI3389308.1 dCTP deaminase [Deltaproteobacteria bacterium]